MKFSEFKKNIDDGIKNVIADNESSDRTKSLEAILNIVNTINRSLILEDVLELVLKMQSDLLSLKEALLYFKIQLVI